MFAHLKLVLSELLLQSCEIIARDYGSKLDILPIPDDYSVGIDEMRYIPIYVANLCLVVCPFQFKHVLFPANTILIQT